MQIKEEARLNVNRFIESAQFVLNDHIQWAHEESPCGDGCLVGARMRELCREFAYSEHDGSQLEATTRVKDPDPVCFESECIQQDGEHIVKEVFKNVDGGVGAV